MATLAHADTSRPAFSRLRAFFKSVGAALVRSGEYSSRVRMVERYQNMSDEELAKRGIKRDDIVRHVFGDLFYC